jgi:Gpi18-like mannosyltransferase
MMGNIKRRSFIILGCLLIGVSIFIRYRIRGLSNIDMEIMQGWYAHLHEHGIRGLADGTFSNYPPAYLYLLWFSTLFSKWFGPLVSLKIIPSTFDFISTFMIHKMARMRYEQDASFLLASTFYLMPTVILNSTGWGQVDSMYTSFLLICVYCLLKEKPLQAMLAFGIAFAFKAQAIFLLPFLGIMFLKGRIRWQYFLLIPAIYILFAFPAVLLGRSWESILLLYADQVSQFEELAKNAPNFYLFIPNRYYDVVVKIGLTIFALVMAIWAWINWRSKSILNDNKLMLTALTSAALVPFLLPKMHDRYFYPADVLAFATSIFLPKMWFVPLLYQLMSGLAYLFFLFDPPIILTKYAVFINVGLVIYVLTRQYWSLAEVAETK